MPATPTAAAVLLVAADDLLTETPDGDGPLTPAGRDRGAAYALRIALEAAVDAALTAEEAGLGRLRSMRAKLLCLHHYAGPARAAVPTPSGTGSARPASTTTTNSARPTPKCAAGGRLSAPSSRNSPCVDRPWSPRGRGAARTRPPQRRRPAERTRIPRERRPPGLTC